jgi:hypothetical protein
MEAEQPEPTAATLQPRLCQRKQMGTREINSSNPYLLTELSPANMLNNGGSDIIASP